jgi:hypothetical protein
VPRRIRASWRNSFDARILSNRTFDSVSVGRVSALREYGFSKGPNRPAARAEGHFSLYVRANWGEQGIFGGFVGTGLGIWDFNHGDNVSANLLIHFGAPIAKYSDDRGKMLFVVESRLFFDELDNIDNNYQFWAGLRFVFR